MAPFAVLLGADGLNQQRSGIGRQVFEVGRRLYQSSDIAELALLIGETVAPWDDVDATVATSSATTEIDTHLRAAMRQIPFVSALNSYWNRRRLDRAAAAIAHRTDGDVLYHEMNMIARPFSGRTVVTVHDLSWRVDPALHPKQRVAWVERGIQRTLSQTARFVAISEFTAGDMVRLLGIERARIDVVHPGTSAHFRPLDASTAASVLAQYDLRDREYVLAVSTIEPRKNFDRLVAAHAELPQRHRKRIPLVIVGGPGWGNALSDATAERARRKGRLRLLGHIPDSDLVALYARCAVTAYPSLYEGFGLPILEAMACAAPVVTSNTTALPATAGGAALLVDPLDVGSITAALQRILDDPEFADTLRAIGPARAACFTWDRMMTGMINCWRAVLAQPR